MDSSKAKKAKAKAKSRTSSRKNQEQAALQNQVMMQQAAAQGGMINPEIQAQQVAMQDQTQAVNPYGRMGTVPPNLYNPGNVVY